MHGLKLGGRRLVVYEEGTTPPPTNHSRSLSYRSRSRRRSVSYSYSRDRSFSRERYARERHRELSRSRGRGQSRGDIKLYKNNDKGSSRKKSISHDLVEVTRDMAKQQDRGRQSKISEGSKRRRGTKRNKSRLSSVTLSRDHISEVGTEKGRDTVTKMSSNGFGDIKLNASQFVCKQNDDEKTKSEETDQ